MTVNILNKDINLLPKYKIDEVANQTIYRLVLFYMLIALMAIVVIAMLCMSGYSSMISSRAKLGLEIAALSLTEERMLELDKVRAAVEARELYQENIDKSNTSMIRLLEFLENENANGVYLSGFSDGVSQDGRKQITISGSAVDTGESLAKDAIAAFMETLKDSQIFEEVFTQTVNVQENADIISVFGDEATGVTLSRFSIICVLM